MLDVVLKFLGLLEYDARVLAIKENLRIRIVEVDGEKKVVTRDLNFERINLVITDGKVSRAYIG